MNQNSTAYWVAASLILVLLVIGVALWYSATTTEVPATGPTCQEKGKVLENKIRELQIECLKDGIDVEYCGKRSQELYEELQTTLQECGYTEG